jgi:photosystem II stability/assembly factor-like uncharacterized protein
LTNFRSHNINYKIMKINLAIWMLFFGTFSVFSQDLNEYFSPLKYRNIGPFRGGRSVAAMGVVDDPLTYYMGTTGGGLWKTEDAGAHWSNISDGFFETGSVGAVAVSQSNSNIVYCGMGEHAIRGVMSTYGDGVYKSTDAGKTWQHTGLKETEQISRIIIHPTNPDIIYVAAQGKYTSATSERGVYKSIDGGKSWKKTLFVNNLTGAAELSMDVKNPQVLYAAMWEHQRAPWKIISGGVGSGLYKSIDAGETWNRMEKGLPKEMGKMAIAVSQSNSDKVYALIESDTYTDQSGLYVSNNAGKSWDQVSGDNRLTQRAWYYIELFIDPNDEDTVYVLSAKAFRSKDGGKSWGRITGTHGDFHDLWIHPNNSNNMVIANDGGAAISYNKGKSWSSQDIMPTAQFYRINTDDLEPYNIYGGQQDNTSVKIKSVSEGSSNISLRDWGYAAGGESAFLAFDKNDPKLVVGGSYLGTIEVLNMDNKSSTQIMASPEQYLGREARNMKYLYNWNAPIVWSKHEPQTIFHAAQLVLKSTDLGRTWTVFSPDLTRDIDEKQGNGGGPYTNEAVGAESYGTISYLVESEYEKGVFYTGSDDGFVHITKDNGATWQNITPKNLGETLVNAIEISPHDPATVYIATTKYKLGDYTPALYKSTNYGKSWMAISNGIPNGSYTRVVREDENQKGLLYAGTEKGIYISYNDGKNWESFNLNLPNTPITDLKIKDNDLVVATSGRSFWILDNLGLLSQYQQNQKNLKLYAPETTNNGSWGSPFNGNSEDFDGTQDFVGVNPANGVELYYYVPNIEKESEIRLKIEDSNGRLIREFTSIKDENYISHNGGGAPPKPTLSKKKGLNRFHWDMTHKIVPGVPNVYIEAGFNGHRVIPGTYTYTISVNDEISTAKGIIAPNKKLEITNADYKEFDSFMTEVEKNAAEMHNKVNMLKSVQDELDEIIKKLKKNNQDQPLISQGEKLIKELKGWDEKMVQRRSQAYDDVENFVNKFTAEYLFLMNQTNSSLPRVNKSNKLRKKELDAQWLILQETVNSLINIKIPAYNKRLWEAGLGAIKL